MLRMAMVTPALACGASVVSIGQASLVFMGNSLLCPLVSGKWNNLTKNQKHLVNTGKPHLWNIIEL